MKILREGDRGAAICDSCERSVTLRYEYRQVHLERTGVDVPDVLAGVCLDCDQVVTVAPQSTPRLKRAREDKSDVLQALLPRQLDDTLGVIADVLDAREDTFTPAMLRFYLSEVARSRRFAGRVERLSRSDLARGGRTVRRSLRLSKALLESAWRGAREAGLETKTDLLKGIIIAAKEDILEGSPGRARRRVVEGIAAGA